MPAIYSRDRASSINRTNTRKASESDESTNEAAEKAERLIVDSIYEKLFWMIIPSFGLTLIALNAIFFFCMIMGNTEFGIKNQLNDTHKIILFAIDLFVFIILLTVLGIVITMVQTVSDPLGTIKDLFGSIFSGGSTGPAAVTGNNTQ